MNKDSLEKLVLVPYVKGYRFRQLGVLILFSSLSLFTGYVITYSLMGKGMDQLLTKNGQLTEQLTRLQKTSDQQASELAALRRSNEIDVQATSAIRDTISQLESRIVDLKQEVAFYKGIMAPADKTKGLSIQKLEFVSTSPPTGFHYKLTLAQVRDNKRYVQGVVAINFIGEKNSQQKIYALKEISSEEQLGIKFKFRYFQTIEGELTLPEGFQPQKVQVVAQSKGKRASRVEQAFVWGNNGEMTYVE